ncbi:MAG: PHP domain-containing protein [Candidatus Paceibacterota bacterium]|jgi:predicted metal-dependent phosphoesterase TrpH|nr:PHP domain-containing protein [Candidatus Paceibacterota bacterium]
MFESLHTHTTLSDGKLSHKQMFLLAESLNVSVVAFTDHDAILNDDAISYLTTVKSSRTKWISGIEISAAPPKEISGLGKGGLHVIGLFVDPKNPALMEHCTKAQAARVERMEKIVFNLKLLGFSISESECLIASGGEAIGRPHIVEALKLHPENENVTKLLIEKMKKEAETDSEVREKYEKMMGAGEHQIPYSLFLSPDAYLKGYEEVTYAPDLDESAKLIRDAGGVAVIAHYFTVKKKMDYFFIEKLLKEKRIDGMETVYGLWQIGQKNESEIEADKIELRKLLKIYDGIASGGPDAHSEEDMRKYASLGTFASQSIGMTEKILESGKVDKKHSSL